MIETNDKFSYTKAITNNANSKDITKTKLCHLGNQCGRQV